MLDTDSCQLLEELVHYAHSLFCVEKNEIIWVQELFSTTIQYWIGITTAVMAEMKEQWALQC